MKDGRGLHMKIKGEETKKAIKEYMDSNPDKLKFEVCEALNITGPTLRKHLKQIEAER